MDVFENRMNAFNASEAHEKLCGDGSFSSIVHTQLFHQLAKPWLLIHLHAFAMMRMPHAIGTLKTVPLHFVNENRCCAACVLLKLTTPLWIPPVWMSPRVCNVHISLAVSEQHTLWLGMTATDARTRARVVRVLTTTKWLGLHWCASIGLFKFSFFFVHTGKAANRSR